MAKCRLKSALNLVITIIIIIVRFASLNSFEAPVTVAQIGFAAPFANEKGWIELVERAARAYASKAQRV